MGIERPARYIAGRCAFKRGNDDPAGDRTQDLRIKSPLLYQLSYRVGRPETSPGDAT